MRDFLRDAPAVFVSVVLHVLVLGMMAFYTIALPMQRQQPAVETVFTEEREQEEFTQQLTIDKTVSENLAVTAGGVVSSAIGSTGGPPISQTKIEQSETLTDAVEVNVSMIDMPSLNAMGTDLGEGEVNGEVGARAEGYGAAMSRISAELIRMMRKQPVLVVWIFDSSLSLTDDREEIAAQFDKIYQELNIATEQAKVKDRKFEALETMVTSFAGDVTKLMDKPSADIDEVAKAIRKIEEDESGEENMFSAIGKVLDEYSKMAARSKRKLAIIVVSDESGDDTEYLEDVIQRSNVIKSPVYFLSRESIFGYPYASVRVIHEETGLPVWPRISRGPETAEVEALQWTGFGKRHGWNAENCSAGFGPWSMVRLARESGGIFFLLADEEEQLAGGLRNQRNYDDFDMKEYTPLLMSRKEYVADRSKSKFRSTIFEIIDGLNPNKEEHKNLNFRWLYPIDKGEFNQVGRQEFAKAIYAIRQIEQAMKLLDSVAGPKGYDTEASQRWRAAYDLLYAQLRAYYVRHIQLTLALDQHDRLWPKIEKEDTNHWERTGSRELLEPDAEQLKKANVTLEDLENYRREAIDYYKRVIDLHSGTPWALRASREMKHGFGVRFKEHFRDPRYDQIKDDVPQL